MPKRNNRVEFLQALPVSPLCQEWPYAKNRLGYGTVGYLGKTWLAHRLAYFLRHGWVPDLLRHTCDNPACMNDAHLLPGTDQDNMDDMVRRGRSCGGERRATLLSAADVLAIRRDYVRGKNRWDTGNAAALATQYGVTVDYIRQLGNRRKNKWPSLGE